VRQENDDSSRGDIIVHSHERDENLIIGGFRFNGESLVRERKLDSFVEVYCGRIPVDKIPKVVVTFGTVKVKH